MLGVLGLFVPVLGLVAVVVAVVGIVRARAQVRRTPGARMSGLLWLGLVLGVLAVAIVFYAVGQAGPPAIA